VGVFNLRPHFIEKMAFLLFQNLLPCAYKSFFGFDCPICGFQRSFFFLLEGDFSNSFKIYPPLLPSLTLIAMFTVYLLNKKAVKIKYLFSFSSVVLAIIIVNYALKMINC